MTNRPTRLLAILLIVLAAAISAAPAVPADDGDSSSHPKIGLALSGGGAKGMAHIGVLQKLEEWDIPVDYVAGTSMGAVVGGLYAAGLSADEIEEAVLSIDWTDLLQDEPERKFRDFRRKEDDRHYLLDIEFGLKGMRLSTSLGYLQGQKLNNMLRNFTQRAAGIVDFDELPVPFRAVATDIVTGEMVVLAEGDLPAAIRASMAIPGVFTPVEIDGRLLVDGGTTRNMPVDVVRAMGADIVIAIDISAPLSDRDQLRSSLAITGQTIGFLTRLNVEQQMPLADLVLRPAVTGVGTLDFSDPTKIIGLGVDEAERMKADLVPLAIPSEAYDSHRASQTVSQVEAPLITGVRIVGMEQVNEEIVRRRVRLQPGDRLDYDALYTDMGRIYGLGDFEAVNYSLVPEEEGVELVIQVREKSWGPNYVRFGLALQADDEQGTLFNLKVLHRATHINRYGAEWRTLGQVGRNTFLHSEFYQPFDYSSRWFVAPAIHLGNELTYDYVDGERAAEYKLRSRYATLDFGYRLGQNAQLRLGPLYGWARVSRETGVEAPEDGEGPDDKNQSLNPESPTLGAVRFEASVDSMDQVTFPREGGAGKLEAIFSREGIGADFDYERIEAGYSHFFSWRRHTIFGSLAGGTSLGSELPAYHQFTLGGIFSFSGYGADELRGNYYAVARLGYYASLFELPTTMGTNVYFGGWVEKGNAWFDSSDIAWDNTGDTLTVMVGADTMFGPIYVAYGKGDGGRSGFLLSIGSGF